MHLAGTPTLHGLVTTHHEATFIVDDVGYPRDAIASHDALPEKLVTRPYARLHIAKTVHRHPGHERVESREKCLEHRDFRDVDSLVLKRRGAVCKLRCKLHLSDVHADADNDGLDDARAHRCLRENSCNLATTHTNVVRPLDPGAGLRGERVDRLREGETCGDRNCPDKAMNHGHANHEGKEETCALIAVPMPALATPTRGLRTGDEERPVKGTTSSGFFCVVVGGRRLVDEYGRRTKAGRRGNRTRKPLFSELCEGLSHGVPQSRGRCRWREPSA